MSQFSLVAMGGTFDIIHKGHLVLLSHAFDISDKVIIGLTSDVFAANKGKVPLYNYDVRLANLSAAILKKFPDSIFEISKLDDDFGPAVFDGNVEALIVSDETSNQGTVLNDLRLAKKLALIKIVVVPMCLAKDGTRISTSRIKNAEIDADGNLLSIDK